MKKKRWALKVYLMAYFKDHFIQLLALAPHANGA